MSPCVGVRNDSSASHTLLLFTLLFSKYIKFDWFPLYIIMSYVLMMVIVCVSCQGNCKMAHIPGFTYPVQEFYLEEIIEKTG